MRTVELLRLLNPQHGQQADAHPNDHQGDHGHEHLNASIHRPGTPDSGFQRRDVVAGHSQLRHAPKHGRGILHGPPLLADSKS